MSSETSNPSMFLYPYLCWSYVNNSNMQVLVTNETPVIVNNTLHIQYVADTITIAYKEAKRL